MDINTLKFRFYESIENKALAAEYKKVKDIFPNTSHTEEQKETVIVPHDDGRPDEERVITKKVVVEDDTVGEDTFLQIVKLDPDSFKNYDTSSEPIKVGQLAKALFIRCYANGEKDFINNKELTNKITEAALYFYQNRKDMVVKNPAGFTSIENFIDVVLNGGKAADGAENAGKKTKELSNDEKLEQIRTKYYAEVPDLAVFKEICACDFLSDIDHGIIGSYAKSILLPLYLKSSTDEKILFHNCPKQIAKKIIQIDNIRDSQQKKDAMNIDAVSGIVEYVFGHGNGINKSNMSKNSHYIQLLYDRCEEGRDFEVICTSPTYDVVWAKTYRATQCGDYCIAPLDYKKNSDFDQSKDSLYYVNQWCTGYSSGYFSRYNGNGQHYYQFINKTKPSNRNDNVQMNIYSNGKYEYCLDGTDGSHGTSVFEKILKNDQILLAGCLMNERLAKNPQVQAAVTFFAGKGITVKAGIALDPKILKDEEPFTYPRDMESLKDKDSQYVQTIDELVIEEGVTQIPAGQFENWLSLQKITFPNSLERIGAFAFHNCISLVKIKKFPPHLQVIASGAFSGCTSLRGSIHLPNSLQAIYPYAFDKHNQSGLSFTISKEHLKSANHKLQLPSFPEDERKWWRTKGRIKPAEGIE